MGFNCLSRAIDYLSDLYNLFKDEKNKFKKHEERLNK